MNLRCSATHNSATYHATICCTVLLFFVLSSCDPGSGDDAGTGLDGPSLNDSSTGDAGPFDAGRFDGGPDSDGGLLDGSIDADIDGGRTWPSQCFVCHGSGAIPAPPLDTLGNEETTANGVGAHQSHMEGDTSWHRRVVCEDCHHVPTTRDEAGHRDTVQPAEMIWSAIASADGSMPTYDYAVTTCSGVYCHGSTLGGGGTNTTPNWTMVGAGQATCGTCHEIPPGPPHPANPDCHTCHPNIDDAWNFIEPERHIDGVVDLIHELSCTSCHGSDGNSAPPNDISGNTATTARGVGAHRSHVGPSSWHREVTCGACHIVPGTESEPGHRDSVLPAELTWGALSSTDGATPAFDGPTTTCAGVYCHGETLISGGTNTTPNWTRVGEDEAACGTCHGLPPSAPHPANSNCSICHPPIAADRSFSDPNRHIDGVVDVVSFTCTGCHGGSDGPAPPRSTTGGSATSAMGVGAHQSHIAPSTWRAPIACTECHVVPTSFSDAGHLDTALPAEITFGARASADTATPRFDPDTGTCAGVYCHGETLLPGGSNTTPTWNEVDVGEAACGTCHGLPPAGGHPSIDACELCHADVVGPGREIIDPSLHIDGVVQVTASHPAGWAAPSSHGAAANNTGIAGCQGCHGAALDGGVVGVSCASCHPSDWQTDCTFCHGGTLTTTGEPPEGIDGERGRRSLAVGAHNEHMRGTHHAPSGCAQCHVVPTSAVSAGHIDGDGRAEVTFGAFNPTATYDGSGTCASITCHGGGSMVWTDDPVLVCTSCHAF